jgi:hypothetical protein
MSAVNLTVLILDGNAYALHEGTLLHCAMHLDGRTLDASIKSLDDWTEVDWHRIDADAYAQAHRAERLMS